MNSTIIDLTAYQKETTELTHSASSSNELIIEIQLLIERLRNSNPIRKVAS